MREVAEHGKSAKFNVISWEKKAESGSRRSVRSSTPEPYDKTKIEINGEGSYDALGTFLSRIESRMERLVKVVGLRIEGHEGGLQPGGPLSVKFEMETYSYNQ